MTTPFEQLAEAWECLAKQVDPILCPDYQKCLRECAHHLRNQIRIVKNFENFNSEKQLIENNKARVIWAKN